MKNCTRPATVSPSASGIPLCGTCTTSIAAIALKISAAKCVPLPTPADEKVDLAGARLRRGKQLAHRAHAEGGRGHQHVFRGGGLRDAGQVLQRVVLQLRVDRGG